MMVADGKDGNPDLIATDEDYLHAAYRVALGRDPGAHGGLHFLGAVVVAGEEAALKLMGAAEERKRELEGARLQ